MSEMETDSQVPVSECSRMPISKAIRTHIIIANGYMDLEGTPDTAENYEMKEVLRAARKETLKKKAELVSELRSLPPCTTFNCSCDAIATHFGPLDNEPSNLKANQDSINSTEIITTPKSDKNKTKSKNKKRKVKKDSSEDFVFPKKTARPVSPLEIRTEQKNNVTPSLRKCFRTLRIGRRPFCPDTSSVFTTWL
ncbi:hypothetical protein TNIN_203071 [Trichonephila inaurata madagascariensis]|uniref:Uncharacterized protein n=1 Tax=Trichonephila inaurata madagascariensis TaxID=2747483 RepID=A0A8X7CRC8_9ARAC|nr:hypothetical protein TNIN_203071 [Trichonephila inaurata madagascariensis]